ncbi:hypothetical protein [Pseudodesulfovibrio sp.]|uniref:hypothetical protein n=1 Tax=Pseudodesulfovibrio sp. TaxID=2035812 RepID=UPI00261F66E2|nr:hypothetical protein [Pseudodesulfovibrio sp.]MDD3312549.1 hypothetical protein [Pseudodesulfovibrio sp.]
MKIYAISACLLLSLLASAAHAQDIDYLARMAEESEIKAIAVVSDVKRMGGNRDGSLFQVTFKTVYGQTPYIPNPFTAWCKTYEYAWQTRSKDMVYFKPRKGQRVYVTVSSNGGSITSFTPVTEVLEAAVRNEPYRLAYRRGEASVRPRE